MKKIFILGVFALLSTTLFSCKADENETTDYKAEAKKETNLKDTKANVGPDDDPVIITPPKK